MGFLVKDYDILPTNDFMGLGRTSLSMPTATDNIHRGKVHVFHSLKVQTLQVQAFKTPAPSTQVLCAHLCTSALLCGPGGPAGPRANRRRYHGRQHPFEDVG